MPTPLAVASLLARNLVPAAGVLLLGWSAGNLLVLYYLDTILAFTVVIVLIARHITGLGNPGERGRPLRGPLDWLRAALGALLGAVLIGIPLGMPVFFLLVQFDWSLATALADPSFVTGIALQVAGSLTGCVQAHRELLARDDDEHVLKHRAAFVMARWLVVVIAAFVGPFGLLGPRIGGALIVLVYAGASVYFETLPGRALLWLNPTGARADAASEKVRHARGKR